MSPPALLMIHSPKEVEDDIQGRARAGGVAALLLAPKEFRRDGGPNMTTRQEVGRGGGRAQMMNVLAPVHHRG